MKKYIFIITILSLCICLTQANMAHKYQRQSWNKWKDYVLDGKEDWSEEEKQVGHKFEDEDQEEVNLKKQEILEKNNYLRERVSEYAKAHAEEGRVSGKNTQGEEEDENKQSKHMGWVQENKPSQYLHDSSILKQREAHYSAQADEGEDRWKDDKNLHHRTHQQSLLMEELQNNKKNAHLMNQALDKNFD